MLIRSGARDSELHAYATHGNYYVTAIAVYLDKSQSCGNHESKVQQTGKNIIKPGECKQSG